MREENKAVGNEALHSAGCSIEEFLSHQPGSAESKVETLGPLEVLNIAGRVLDCPLVKHWQQQDLLAELPVFLAEVCSVSYNFYVCKQAFSTVLPEQQTHLSHWCFLFLLSFRSITRAYPALGGLES